MHRRALLLVLACGLLGCSQNCCSTGNVEPSSPADGPEVEAAPPALPENFPKDVPAYPGAKVTRTNVRETTSVTWQTADSVKDVAAWCKKNLSSNGWKIGSTIDEEGGSVFSAENGRRRLSVVIADDAGTTTISLILSGK